uniref:Uncharacterized protein n=1 Tax=Ceratitis capitata TaxID=7213 RepID=W8C8Z4_CERCA
MSAEVANCFATAPITPPSTPADFKNDEPKIYISSAKLELKLSAVQTQHQSGSKDYVWHTQVLPTATEPTQEEEEEVSKRLVNDTAAPVEAVNRNMFTSAQRHGAKSGSLAATLYDFMDVERYHSERNQSASLASVSNVRESTDV